VTHPTDSELRDRWNVSVQALKNARAAGDAKAIAEAERDQHLIRVEWKESLALKAAEKLTDRTMIDLASRIAKEVSLTSGMPIELNEWPLRLPEKIKDEVCGLIITHGKMAEGFNADRFAKFAERLKRELLDAGLIARVEEDEPEEPISVGYRTSDRAPLVLFCISTCVWEGPPRH
jgi:hypothetical protein